MENQGKQWPKVRLNKAPFSQELLSDLKEKYKTKEEINARLDQLRSALKNDADNPKKTGQNESERMALISIRNGLVLKGERSYSSLEEAARDPDDSAEAAYMADLNTYNENEERALKHKEAVEEERFKKIEEIDEKIKKTQSDLNKREASELKEKQREEIQASREKGSRKTAIESAARKDLTEHNIDSLKDRVSGAVSGLKDRLSNESDSDYSGLSLAKESAGIELKEYAKGEKPTVEGGFLAHTETERGIIKKTKRRSKFKKGLDKVLRAGRPGSFEIQEGEPNENIAFAENEYYVDGSENDLDNPDVNRENTGSPKRNPEFSKKALDSVDEWVESLTEPEFNSMKETYPQFEEELKKAQESGNLALVNKIMSDIESQKHKKRAHQGPNFSEHAKREEDLKAEINEAAEKLGLLSDNLNREDIMEKLKKAQESGNSEVAAQILSDAENNRPTREEDELSNKERAAKEPEISEHFQRLREEYQETTKEFRKKKKIFDANKASVFSDEKKKMRAELQVLSDNIYEISKERRKYSLEKLIDTRTEKAAAAGIDFDDVDKNIGEKAFRHANTQRMSQIESGADDLGKFNEGLANMGTWYKETWHGKLSLTQKLAISAVVGSGLSALTGGATTLTQRIGGMASGVLGGMGAGFGVKKLLSLDTKRLSNKYKEGAVEAGTDITSGESYENLEEILNKQMKSLTAKEKRESRIAAGAALVAGFSIGGIMRDELVGNGTLSDDHSIDNKISKVGTPLESSPEIRADYVEASDRGAIQTFVNLKDSLEAEYPTEATQPQIVKDILAMDAIDLAKKYGFYDPSNPKESSMLLVGEELGISHDGKLEYIKANGEKLILEDGQNYDFNSKSDTEKHWGEKGGEMFDYKEIDKLSEKIKANPENINIEFNNSRESLEGVLGSTIRKGDLLYGTTFGLDKISSWIPKFAEFYLTNPEPSQTEVDNFILSLNDPVMSHFVELLIEQRLDEKELEMFLDATSLLAPDFSKIDNLDDLMAAPTSVTAMNDFLHKVGGFRLSPEEIDRYLPENTTMFATEEACIKFLSAYADNRLDKQFVLGLLSNEVVIGGQTQGVLGAPNLDNRIYVENGDLTAQELGALNHPLLQGRFGGSFVQEGTISSQDKLYNFSERQLDQEMRRLEAEYEKLKERGASEAEFESKLDEIREVSNQMEKLRLQDLGPEGRLFESQEISTLERELGMNYDGMSDYEKANTVRNAMYDMRDARGYQGLETFKNSGLLPGLDFSNFKDIRYVEGDERKPGLGFMFSNKMPDVHTLEMTTVNGDKLKLFVSEDGERIAFDGKKILGNYPQKVLTGGWNKDLRNGLSFTNENIRNMTEFINSQASIRESFDKYQSLGGINADPGIIESPGNGFLALSESDRNFVAKEMFKSISNDPLVSGLNWGSPLAAIIESNMTANELVSLMKEENLTSMELSSFAKNHNLTQGNEFMTLMIYADYFEEMIRNGTVDEKTKISSLF